MSPSLFHPLRVATAAALEAGARSATNFTARALPTTPRPRPQRLWPVDAEELAERLLGE